MEEAFRQLHKLQSADHYSCDPPRGGEQLKFKHSRRSSHTVPAPASFKEGVAAGSRLPPKRYLGVRRRSWGRYTAEIAKPLSKGKWWLGAFDTAEEAACAYDCAAWAIRGRKARTNFPLNPSSPPPSPPRPPHFFPKSNPYSLHGWPLSFQAPSNMTTTANSPRVSLLRDLISSSSSSTAFHGCFDQHEHHANLNYTSSTTFSINNNNNNVNNQCYDQTAGCIGFNGGRGMVEQNPNTSDVVSSMEFFSLEQPESGLHQEIINGYLPKPSEPSNCKFCASGGVGKVKNANTGFTFGGDGSSIAGHEMNGDVYEPQSYMNNRLVVAPVPEQLGLPFAGAYSSNEALASFYLGESATRSSSGSAIGSVTGLEDHMASFYHWQSATRSSSSNAIGSVTGLEDHMASFYHGESATRSSSSSAIGSVTGLEDHMASFYLGESATRSSSSSAIGSVTGCFDQHEHHANLNYPSSTTFSNNINNNINNQCYDQTAGCIGFNGGRGMVEQNPNTSDVVSSMEETLDSDIEEFFSLERPESGLHQEIINGYVPKPSKPSNCKFCASGGVGKVKNAKTGFTFVGDGSSMAGHEMNGDVYGPQSYMNYSLVVAPVPEQLGLPFAGAYSSNEALASFYHGESATRSSSSSAIGSVTGLEDHMASFYHGESATRSSSSNAIGSVTGLEDHMASSVTGLEDHMASYFGTTSR